MDGLCRAVGSPMPCFLDGTTYLLKPLTLGDLGSCEFEILARRFNPYDAVRAIVDVFPEEEALCREYHDLAVKEVRNDRNLRQVTVEELMEWMYTAHGVIFTGWLTLWIGKSRPAFNTYEEADEFFRLLDNEEIIEYKRRQEMVSGLDLLSQMDWPGRDTHNDNVRRHSWRKSVQSMATSYRIPADQMAVMTLYQFKIYCADEAELGGVSRVAPIESNRLSKGEKKPAKRVADYTDDELAKMSPARREVLSRIRDEARKGVANPEKAAYPSGKGKRRPQPPIKPTSTKSVADLTDAELAKMPPAKQAALRSVRDQMRKKNGPPTR